ncbi:MAG: hypothetical protein IT170_00725 [Bryobacterales bacterium]|nr:hypothetical protein [Bryobacterales bacterium]
MTRNDFRIFGAWNSARTVLAVLLCLAMLAAPGTGFGQTAAPAKLTLNIVIVEGEGAVNNIRQRVAREPIVRVEDENHKPVAGATVVFLLPGDGAGGTFPGNQNMVTVQTNQNGEAVARGLRPNNVTGDFAIRVTASFQGATATAVVNQTNALAGAAAAAGAGGGAAAATAAGISAKVLVIIGIAAAAAVGGGVYAATRDNSNGGGSGPGGPSRTPTAIAIGAPSVGAP